MPRFVAALLPLVLLAACGDDRGTVGVEPAPDQVAGRVFVGRDVTGHRLVAGSSLRLAFDGSSSDGLNANAGCNHLGGTGKVQDGTLVATIDSMTEMGCEQQLMEQDTWLVDFLQSRPTVHVDSSSLELTKGETTVRLADEAAVHAQHPIALVGTAWQLESLLDGAGADGAVSSIPGGVSGSLRIEDGRVLVDTGCNQGSGQASVDESAITIGPLNLSKKACDPAAAAVEQRFTAVLTGRVDYRQDYDVLTLTSSDGQTGLQFRAG